MQLYFPISIIARANKPVLMAPATIYDGMVEVMLVMIRLVEMLTIVCGLGRNTAPIAALRRDADLVLDNGKRDIGTAADGDDLATLHRRFVAIETVSLISVQVHEAG